MVLSKASSRPHKSGSVLPGAPSPPKGGLTFSVPHCVYALAATVKPVILWVARHFMVRIRAAPI
jgi:hypothetical protein